MMHKISISVRLVWRKIWNDNFVFIEDSQNQTIVSTKTPLCWLTDYYFIIVWYTKGLSFFCINIRQQAAASFVVVRRQAITKIIANLLWSGFYL